MGEGGGVCSLPAPPPPPLLPQFQPHLSISEPSPTGKPEPKSQR